MVLAVGSIERREPLDDKTTRFIRGNRTAGVESILGTSALGELHHDVVEWAFRTDIEDGQDVGVLQGSHSPGFRLKTASQTFPGHAATREQLDRPGHTENIVLSSIDLCGCSLSQTS